MSGMRFGQVLFSMAVGVALFARAQLANQNFEAGLGAWTVTGAWGVTAADAWSPTRSATDSPGAFYANNTDTTLALAAPLDLSASVRPALRFYHRHALEPSYDWAHVEISVDGGTSWIGLADYTGTATGWTREQLDLTPYADQTAVWLRFRVVTDASVVMDGWYLDDVLVGEAPAAPFLTNVTALGVSAVSLAWEPSASASATAYRIYRSQTAGFDWRDALLIGETDAATLTFTDIAAAPKATFHYRVMAVSADALHAEGNEIPVTLPAGMDYPFLDTGEAGGTYWIADGGWTLSEERAHAGSRSWSDSPGTLYPNSGNASLRLAMPLDLKDAAMPVLTFWQLCDIQSGDAGVVEVSINNGTDWSVLKTVTGVTATNAWSRERITLAAYAGQAAVLLRFRLTTSASGQSDGWWLDDISVAEAPAAIPSLLLDQATSHTLRLSWPQSADPVFSHYAVHRVTGVSGVTHQSPCVAVIEDPSQTEWTDTDLALDTAYVYRVFAVSPYGTYSADGAESTLRTLNNPLPFADGFEADSLSWNFMGTWAVTTETNATGSACLADSPLGFYANNLNGGNNYALTAVDLTGAAWPVLRFRDRHAFYDTAAGDRGILDVSANGVNWTRVYGVTGARDAWAEQAVDLSRWRGQANLRVRFYVESDGGGVGDGWFVDDVSVAEHAPGPAQVLPFAERFEGGLSNWLAGGWTAATNAPYEGGGAAEGFPCRWTPQNRDSYRMVLNRALDLSGAAAPQVTFWARRSEGDDYTRLYVHLSKDGGLSWLDLSGHVARGPAWTRYQFAVPADYRVAGVRLSFNAYAYYEVAGKLQVDKLTIEEAPPAVTLASPVPHLKSVDLAWTAYPDDGTFQRYEIYRRESAGVTIGDTLAAAFTDRESLAFTDAGLSIGKTYFYKVFAVNSNDTYVASNEAQATTVPIPMPFADTLEDVSQWDTLGAWGVETNGSEVCLADSPGVQYANSLNGGNNYALTAVDLTGAAWPVLRFRDRHAFYETAAGDRGILDVSANGTTWIRVYGVTGARDAWAEQAVDLSRWRGQANLRVRFYVESDGGGVGDGWFVDDVSVAEHAPGPAQALPFAERFEGGLSNWLAGGWTAATNAPYEGGGAAEGFPCRWTPQNRDSYRMVLNRALDLSGAAAPQVTFWARRSEGDDYTRLYVNLSKDGGLTWLDLSGHVARGPEWTRYQFAVPADYRVADVRLSLNAYAYYEVSGKLQVDKLTVEETPPAVTLASPTAITVNSLTLAWSGYSGSGFQSYKVFRHTAQNVNETHTQVATITDPAVTNFIDVALAARTRYFYKVYVYDESDTGTPSNEASAQTLGVPMGWTDSFDAGVEPAWTFNGTWGIQPGAGVDGSAALTDSPGDYANSSDTWAQTAVDLSSAAWPILVFKDCHALPPSGDSAYVQIGAADNANIASIAWTTVYSVREARSAWREQQIDLSRWKGRHTVYIRFRLGTDGGVVDDGWAIDDMAIREHTPLPVASVLHERFESGLADWLNSGWAASTNAPYEGAGCVRNHEHQIVQAGTDAWLVYGGELDLRDTVSPKVTLWARGWRGYNNYGRLYVRLSKDGGVTWLDLSGILAVTDPWARFQVAVPADYRTNGVRVAVQSYAASYDLDSTFFLDALGVGDEPPGAPVPLSPADGATVTVVRPTLVVTNAVDSQSDPLTYSFEVYTNADLSAGSLVAQNPAIAAGAAVTAWQIDAELTDEMQVWWRCRATDSGANSGPWSATGTFFVDLQNTPPEAPVLVAPSDGATLPDASGYFVWFASSDPDAGDAVTGYQFQIAADETFTNVLVAAAVAAQPATLLVQMNALPNYGALVLNARYYWRVRALDLWDAPSVWTTASFVYGELQTEPPAPVEPVTITGMTIVDGQILLSWTPSAYPVRVEFTASLTDPQWVPVNGATGLGGTTVAVPFPTGLDRGFFRVVVEDLRTE